MGVDDAVGQDYQSHQVSQEQPLEKGGQWYCRKSCALPGVKEGRDAQAKRAVLSWCIRGTGCGGLK